jgi:integrase
MPITQRGQSFQVAVSHKGERFRRQFPTHLEAQQWELDCKLRFSKGERPDMGENSSAGGSFVIKVFGELGEYLIRHHWTGTRGEKGAVINMRHMIRIIGAQTLIAKIDRHTINLALAALRDEGYPDSTVNKKLSTVRVALNYALGEGWIAKVPEIPFFDPGEGRERVFTAEEEKAQVAWCKAHGEQDLLDYITLGYDTGMRQGECLELRAHNLDEDVLVLRGAPTKRDRGTKAANTRRIPLTDRALKIILRRIDAAKGKALFDGYDKDRLRRSWDAMRQDLGFTEDEEYVPHALRHSFCSRLVNDHNVNLKIVKELAGHLRLETTEKYVHLHEDAMSRAIAMLAPRGNSVYTPATTRSVSVPHANVSCHADGVEDSIEPRTGDNVLELQRKSA